MAVKRGSLVAIAAGIIALATLTPTSEVAQNGGRFVWCIACGDFGLADFAANVALFVPLGWALGRAGLKPATVIAIVVCATIGIELMQLWFLPGRVASLSDILANTTGGVAGLALPRLLPRLRGSTTNAGRATAVYGGLLAVSLWAGTVVQGISMPDALGWTRQSPRLPGYTDFTGIVREVRINGTPVATGEWLALSAKDSTVVTLELVAGVPDQRRAEIIATNPRTGPAWAWVDQQARDARAHFASASDGLRLRGQDPVVADALPATAGESVMVRLVGRHFGYDVVVETKGGTAVRHASITPGDGWRLFMPFARTRERLAPLLGALWMAALLAPLSYLATGHSAAAVGVAGAAAAVYLLLLPLALGCAWLSLAGWCGAAGGFLMGKVMARWTS